MASVIVVAAADSAPAQRGADFIVQQDTEKGARTGYPGIFDTTTVRRGKMIISYPWLGVDYGLTENWSVGTSALFLAPLIALNPAAFVRSRYRVFANNTTTAVLDGALQVAYTRSNELRVFLNYSQFAGTSPTASATAIR